MMTADIRLHGLHDSVTANAIAKGRSRARTVISSLFLTVVAVGCSPKESAMPGAQAPERQSESEYDLARDYFYKGQPRTALDHALKSIAFDDGNVKALYFTSAIYLWFCSTIDGLTAPDCRLQDAEKYARLAFKTDESYRDARNLLSQILILEKRYAEAIHLLEPLVNDPSYEANYLAWGNLGWAQIQSGAIDAGLVSLRNSVTQPRFCVGHYRLGVGYEKKGALSQAESSFTAAVQVDNQDCQNLQDAWEGRARVRMKLGKVAEARGDFQKCKDISAESITGKACVQMLASRAGSSSSQLTPP